MAEAMTVETIAEADWQLQGYWTRLRVPLRMARGYSDIDVLAYQPESRHLVLSESKVRGPKKDVYAFTAYTQEAYGNILAYDGDNYFAFLHNVRAACAKGAIFSDFKRMVGKVTIQLVSNYFVAEEMRQAARDTVLARVSSEVPQGVEVDVRLESTLEVLCRVIRLESESEQGRRYGHPVLDLIREFNRYMHPQVRYAGQSRQAVVEVREQLARMLMVALQGD